MSFSNFNIGQRLENLETSEPFDAYARVDVVMGEDEEGEVLTVSYPAGVGDDAGRILTVDMPMCTDTEVALRAAQRIYNSLTTLNQTAFQYQPILATKVMADPSMEFGDSVDVNGVHAGFYTRDVTFNPLMETDLTAPTDEEIDHEYPYQDGQQRQITRNSKGLRAGLYVTNQAISAEVERVNRDVFDDSNPTSIKSILNIQADAIEARVSATGGNNASFGWKLDSTSHSWYAGSTEVMRISRSGLVIKGNADITGKITATSGQIGGMTIGNNAIYSNGMASMSSTQTTGVHMSPNGIKLGQKFSVDPSGNVTATRLTVDTLVIGGTSVSAATLNSRANSAYNSTSSGGFCYNGAVNGNSAQTTWNNAQNPNRGIDYIKAAAASFGSLGVTGPLSCERFSIYGWGFGRAYSQELGTYVWTAIGY